MQLITNVDTSVYPYNDDYMVYDLDSRQYLLTVSGVKDLLGFNLETLIGTIEEADYFCLEMSDIVYNFIYSYALLSQTKYKRWIIAKDGNIRELFKRVLLAQTRYAVRSGANLLGDMHGVNFERGKALDINSIRGSIEMSSQALKLIQRTGLLYSGFQYFSEYAEDDSF